jgi:iron complex outermembrane receptor protein
MTLSFAVAPPRWYRRTMITAAGALLALVPDDAAAQQDTTRRADTLAVHELSEVTVTGSGAGAPASGYTQLRIPTREIAERDAMSAADVARLIPAAHVQTNSRGETLVYLRDAGDRQVSVFFDGALLNIPWDNRIDLSLVPASVIGGMTVAKGVPPIEYGTNVLGGAVNLTSRVPGATPVAQAEVMGGTAARRQAAFSYQSARGRVSYEGAVGYGATDGQPLPDGARLPFSQRNGELRSNTDSRIMQLFLRGTYRTGSAGRVGLSVLYADAEKGVAPEGHLDPDVSRVRYWRYPLWRNATAILSGDGFIGGRTFWKASAWVNRFQQHIVSFASMAYDDPREREEDHDLTVGTRGVVQRQMGVHSIKLALNALTSTHRQRDVDLTAAEPTGPEAVYQQQLLSTGVEYEVRPSASLTLSAGAGVDAMFAPQTGDKPSIDPFIDYTVTTGVHYALPGGWFVRAAAGRKTRFPTMRELFGEALNRFLVNPDLQPESSWLTELAVGVHGTRMRGEIIPFATFTSNSIDQRNVQLPGEEQSRRQRINLPGSRVTGVELVAAMQASPRLDLESHVTFMRPRRVQQRSGDPVHLAEKPAALARASASYATPGGFGALVEGVYTGRAYSLAEDNDFVPLPTSLAVNLRLSHALSLRGAAMQIFGRVDNVTNELVVPQLGLPAAGRSFTSGVSVSF